MIVEVLELTVFGYTPSFTIQWLVLDSMFEKSYEKELQSTIVPRQL